jgi:hypothetical protein
VTVFCSIPKRNEDAITAFRTGVRYIKIYQGRRMFPALFDPGSELNVVGSQILNHLKADPIPGPTLTMVGIGGEARASLWYQINCELSNGIKIVLRAVKSDQLGPNILLGMPFIKKIQGKVDFRLDIIETPKYGFLELLPRELIGPIRALLNQTELTEREEKLSEDDIRQLEHALNDAKSGGGDNIFLQLRHMLLDFCDVWSGNRRGCEVSGGLETAPCHLLYILAGMPF